MYEGDIVLEKRFLIERRGSEIIKFRFNEVLLSDEVFEGLSYSDDGIEMSS